MHAAVAMCRPPQEPEASAEKPKILLAHQGGKIRAAGEARVDMRTH
jgi:hypothetical protein